jgi:alpha-1,2-mannosyltransferase
MTASSRSVWAIRYREARGHAIVLASISWLAAAVIVFGTPGYRDLVGHLKGADFVHFYTLGRIALNRSTGTLYDAQAQHQVQAQLVPDSVGDFFVPVYPPQTALIFAPFSVFSYGVATLLWAAVTSLLYAWVVRKAWRPASAALPDTTFLLAAAAGFPPFWSLVLHGQTTVVPLIGLCLGWIALERRQPFLAGLAFGLLAIKPQLGLVLAAVVLVCGEWSLLAGGIVSVAMQTGLVWLVMGADVIVAYVRTLTQLRELAPMLEPRPYQLHSIRAVTNLLPSWVGTTIYLLLSLAVTWQAIRVWRREMPVRVRLGVLVLATVLVSPHLTIYDATVLVLPLIWIGGWIAARGRTDIATTFWTAVYWLVVTLFIPTALFIRIQISVFVLGWLFLKVTTGLIAADRAIGSPAEVA